MLKSKTYEKRLDKNEENRLLKGNTFKIQISGDALRQAKSNNLYPLIHFVL